MHYSSSSVLPVLVLETLCYNGFMHTKEKRGHRMFEITLLEGMLLYHVERYNPIDPAMGLETVQKVCSHFRERGLEYFYMEGMGLFSLNSPSYKALEKVLFG